MENCHHDVIAYSVFSSDIISLLITIFLTGVAGSFTHCIAMCGPLAMMQANIRLMHTTYDKMNQLSKFKAAFTLPYYFGKTLSYCTVFTISYFSSQQFREFWWSNYIAATFLILTAALFAFIGVSKSMSINLGFGKSSKITKHISNLTSKFKLEPFGAKGILLGFILGFIPCAFVIGIIMMVLTIPSNYLVGLSATVLFGLSTIPGLFVVSYFGNYAFSKIQPFANVAFRILAFVNALLLLRYALKLL